MSEVKFTDNRQKVKAQLDANIVKALNAIAIEWLSNVRQYVPVDTSRLLKSMTYQLDIRNKKIIVGTDVEYGPFVELGTRKMRAQPYMFPSVVRYIEDYKAIARRVLGSDWEVGFSAGGLSY